MKPPIPIFSSIPSCESFGNRQLVCASCVPKLKLSSPRARIVFSQGQVAALPRVAGHAACLCIICSQTQTAASTRKSCLLMAGCCTSTAGSLDGGGDPSAATCIHEKTRLARGDGSLSLETFNEQTSCIPPKPHKMA